MRKLEANSRWALSGTPIQNSLLDIASLYQFLRVDPYTDCKMFKEHIRWLSTHRSNHGLAKIKRLIRCIMLRRSIATVSLPRRTDLICRLDFSPEEAEVYDRARLSTLERLDDAIDSKADAMPSLNVLPWINSLRMICNLGVRAKTPQAQREDHNWDLRSAQEMFNSLVIAGAAICADCSVDLGAVATEVADQVSGVSAQPRLASCSHLVCGSCLERSGGLRCPCRQLTAHTMLPVSTLSSALSVDDDHVSASHMIPTKIIALLQDLNEHIQVEKW